MVDTWLNIIGIGENGHKGLSKASKECIAKANIIFGSERHLQLAQVKDKAQKWPSPFSYNEVYKHRHKNVVVLASGDPFWFGVGSKLVKTLEAEEWQCFPSYSTFSLATNKLGWAIEETECCAIHAKPVETLKLFIENGRNTIVLCKDFTQIKEILEWLAKNKIQTLKLILLSKLGNPKELILELNEANVEELISKSADLSPLALGIVLKENTTHLGLFAGQKDKNFQTDGNFTKQPIRAITLSELQTFGNEILWDVGAGSGTISVEWCIRNRNNRAYAIEKRDDRIQYIKENVKVFGLKDRVFIKKGLFENLWKKLPKPDAVFIGGGATNELINNVLEILPEKGRLVINAVTLETQQLVLLKQQEIGGKLKKVEISNVKAVGSKSVWESNSTIVQWSYFK
jgi:precorrin-6Y C5,15-methyltransferase (decarboxylating)